MKIAVIGQLTYIKGLPVVEDMINHIEEKSLDIEILQFGKIEKEIKSKYFKSHGSYNRHDLVEILSQNNIDIILIPSIWPETFSYTTQEAIEMNAPLAVFDLGAPAQRLKDYSRGIVIDKIDAKYALDKIIEFSKGISGEV